MSVFVQVWKLRKGLASLQTASWFLVTLNPHALEMEAKRVHPSHSAQLCLKSLFDDFNTFPWVGSTWALWSSLVSMFYTAHVWFPCGWTTGGIRGHRVCCSISSHTHTMGGPSHPEPTRGKEEPKGWFWPLPCWQEGKRVPCRVKRLTARTWKTLQAFFCQCPDGGDFVHPCSGEAAPAADLQRAWAWVRNKPLMLKAAGMWGQFVT